MSNEKIMVVEDEWVVADQLCRSLKDLGYTVCSTASTGDEAIRNVEADRPDLILMDIVLKGKMNGIEAAGRIASQFNIPVIYLTAYTNQEYIERAKQTNPFGYLVKPVSERELAATVEMALHRHTLDRRLKTVENALRESEERFHTALKNSPIIISNQDRELRYTWIYNPQPGFKPETALGKTDADLLAAEDAARMTEIKRRVLETGVPAREEVRTTVGGQVFFYDLTAEPLRDDGGDIVGVSSVLVDVTERQSATKALIGILEDERRARASLQESEENFRRSLDESPLGVRVVTKEGETLYINRATLDIFGCDSIEEWQTTPTVKRYTEQSYAEFKVRREKRRLYEDDSTEYEIDIVRKDGEVRNLYVWRMRVLWNGEEHYQLRYSDITDSKRSEKQLQETLDSLRRAVGATIQVMVSAVEVRDPYTSGHQIRSADLARAIAAEMGLPQEKTDAVRMAGSIHDIGKIAVPAEILSKPTKLHDFEFRMIMSHAQAGYDILKDIEFPWPLAEIVYQHHERMDGSGYPRNLKGEEICIEARILAVADVVEAMASHRPYRPALGIDAALKEIENHRGTRYDIDAVDACLRKFREQGFKLEGD